MKINDYELTMALTRSFIVFARIIADETGANTPALRGRLKEVLSKVEKPDSEPVDQASKIVLTNLIRYLEMDLGGETPMPSVAIH